MINELSLLLIVTGVVIFLFGSLFLVFAAYRERWYWGLFTVLVPFGVLFFVMLNWRQARYAFFSMIIGVVIAFSGERMIEDTVRMEMSAVFGRSLQPILANYPEVQAWLDQRMGWSQISNGTRINPTDTAIVTGTDTELDFPAPEVTDSEVLRQIVSKSLYEEEEESTRKLNYGFFEISHDDLYRYYNQRIRVTLNTGFVYDAKLLDANQFSLSIEQDLGGGSVAYEHRYSTLEKIEAYGVITGN